MRVGNTWDGKGRSPKRRPFKSTAGACLGARVWTGTGATGTFGRLLRPRPQRAERARFAPDLRRGALPLGVVSSIEGGMMDLCDEMGHRAPQTRMTTAGRRPGPRPGQMRNRQGVLGTLTAARAIVRAVGPGLRAAHLRPRTEPCSRSIQTIEGYCDRGHRSAHMNIGPRPQSWRGVCVCVCVLSWDGSTPRPSVRRQCSAAGGSWGMRGTIDPACSLALGSGVWSASAAFGAFAQFRLASG